jgi:hypothetical protein
MKFLQQTSLLRWLAAAALLGSAYSASAATITAASCAQSAVQSAINSAADGDTVVVPAGTCTWSSTVNVNNKTIILRGAGSGAGGTRINHSGGNHTLLQIDAGSKRGKMDVSGFWFYGAANGNWWNGSAMIFGGPAGWKNLRIHHNVFEGNHPWTMKGDSRTHGLIDNNTFKGNAYGIMLYGEGKSDWSSPLTLGTGDFFFVEDNNFDFNDFYGTVGVPVMDMDYGGRQVFRYNRIANGMWETHDMARSGLVSAHAYELYMNTFTSTTSKWKGFDISAGTGVIWGNTINGPYQIPIGAIDYKSFDPRSVRLCDGSDPADKNVPGESGWICQYQIGSHGEGASAVTLPVYLWNNTANGGTANMQCTNGCNHVKEGRDFINGTAKPGYAPYRYPHPLQSGEVPPTTAPLPAPSGLQVR